MAALSPAEEAQREDEKLLSENNRAIEEVLQLIDDSTDREEAERRVDAAEARVLERQEGNVFHDHKAWKIPLHGHTSNMLLLAGSLELHWKTRRHGADLHRSLSSLVRQRVEILKRILERGLF